MPEQRLSPWQVEARTLKAADFNDFSYFYVFIGFCDCKDCIDFGNLRGPEELPNLSFVRDAPLIHTGELAMARRPIMARSVSLSLLASLALLAVRGADARAEMIFWSYSGGGNGDIQVGSLVSYLALLDSRIHSLQAST